MKSGFTFIELIFVIVILGIVAAVAITKITATRDDAHTSKQAFALATAVEDFSVFYTAKGYFSTPNEMTYVTFLSSGDTNLTTDSIQFNECITVSSVGYNSSDKNALTISYSAANGNINDCHAVANAAKNITNFTDKNSNSSKLFVVGGSGIF